MSAGTASRSPARIAHKARSQSKRPKNLFSLPDHVIATNGYFWVCAYRNDVLKLTAFGEVRERELARALKDSPLWHALTDAENALRKNIRDSLAKVVATGCLLLLRPDLWDRQ